MSKDIQELSNMFTVGIGHLTGLISCIGTFIAVLIINVPCFLYYSLTSSLLTFLYVIKAKKYSQMDYEMRKSSEKSTSIIGELIKGINDIKMLNAKSPFLSKLESTIIDKNDNYIKMRNVDINYNFIIGSLKTIFEFGLVLLLIFLVHNEIVTISLAIALYSYRTKLMGDLMEKVSLFLEEVNAFNLSSERVFNLMTDNIFPKEKFGKKHLTKIKGDFEFKNVTFGYIPNHPVLKNISFKVNHNETIAFVGKSGVGKSTIFSLLTKMYDINSGLITIDGINIQDLDETSIRGNITVISQSPYLFNMSIKDNLRLVKEDLSIEEMKNVCKLACIDEFIETLPNRYDTVIGEGGLILSGGEKQRLAIARAFLQKTEIILFDEATSALDNKTQKEISKAIDNLKKDYTILIIAHRLSTIINADRIMFIENGKIIKSGTHQELLDNCLSYKKLYEAEIN